MSIEVSDHREIRWQADGGDYFMSWDRAGGLVRIGTPAGSLAVGQAAALEILKGLQVLLDVPGVKAPARDLPANAGQPWTEALDTQLAQAWYAEQSVAEIAEAMGRTKGSISSRLVRIGLVDNRQDAEARPGRKAVR